MKKILLITGVSVLALAALCSGAWATGKAISGNRTETHDVAASVRSVVLDVDTGNVDLVRGGDHVSVRETRHWDFRKAQVTREVHDGVLTVKARCHGGWPLSSCKTNLHVALPAGVAVRVETHVGNVTGLGLETRDANVRTDVGDVDLALTQAPVTLNAESNVGDVSVEVPHGRYAVETRSDIGDDDVNGLRIVVREDFLRVGHKPASLSMAEAGAAPLAGLTALLSVEALDLQGGERVLIVGACGGVGAIAVQLCVAAGATVIAPGHPHDVGRVPGSLGAAEVPERGTVPAAYDALIDLVSQDADSFAAQNRAGLRAGGRASSPLPGIGAEGPDRFPVYATSDPAGVERLSETIDRLSLRVPLCEAFSFGELGAALAALGEHKQGKLSVL